MGKTEIGWTDFSANWWIGCEEISSGCARCYAKTYAEFRGWAKWGSEARGGTRRRAKGVWSEVPRWNRAAAKAGVKRLVFTESLSDFFERWYGPILNHQNRQLFKCYLCGEEWVGERDRCPNVPASCGNYGADDATSWLTMNDLRREALAIMEQCPNLIFQVLTKRPGEVRSLLKECGRDRLPSNCWLGTSVSDQPTFEKYGAALAACADLAPLLFISAEPLLSPINFGFPAHRWFRWIIVGGESGPKRRDCGVGAIVSAAEQCVAAGVPCFVKQDCAKDDGQQGRIPDHIWSIKQLPAWEGLGV